MIRLMKYVVSLLVFTYTFGAHALTLKSKFTHAEVGDFIVCEGRGSLSLVFVKQGDPRTVILEEISFPKRSKPKKMGVEGWQEWLNKGAPGHTSWVAIEIDLNETGIMECFSYSRDAWLSLASGDSFLLRLLDLKLNKIHDHERRKIGPEPLKGPDNRKMWNPPLVLDGERQSGRLFDVFRINWPRDDSPLSNKDIEIYFNQKDKLFPFPYLVRIRDMTDASLSFHVLDSGKGLKSPKQEMPRRAFYIQKTSFQKKESLEIEMVAPLYYKKFLVHALDASHTPGPPIAVPFEAVRDGEKLTIKINREQVSKKLKSFHSYAFCVSTSTPAVVDARSRELFTP